MHATCIVLNRVDLRDPFAVRVPFMFLENKSFSSILSINAVTFFLDRTDLLLVVELAGVAVLLVDADVFLPNLLCMGVAPLLVLSGVPGGLVSGVFWLMLVRLNLFPGIRVDSIGPASETSIW